MSATDLLHAVLERFCVSERANLLRALEQASDLVNDFDESSGAPEEISFNAAREQMKIELMDEFSHLTTREAFLFRRWAEGATMSEIASEMNESLPILYRQLKAVQKRVLRRLSKQQDHSLRAKITAPAARLEAFTELQRRLCLTSAKAGEWQNAVHEARR